MASIITAARPGIAIRSAHSIGLHCVMMRRLWRCVALRWRSSATLHKPGSYRAELGAPSQARARALRDRRAEIALVSRELDWCFNGMVTAPTPRMRVSSRYAYSC